MRAPIRTSALVAGLAALGCGGADASGPDAANVPAGADGAGGTADAAPNVPSVLARSTRWPTSIAIDGDHVYFIEVDLATGAGVVNKVPKAGGAVTPLVPDPWPFGIAVDGGRVIWGSRGDAAGERILAAGLGGEDPATLTTLDPGVTFIALAAREGHAYFTEWGVDTNAIRRVPVVAGGASEPVVTLETFPQGLVVGPGVVTWAEDSGHIRRCALPCAEVEDVAFVAEEAFQLAVRDDDVYWTTQSIFNTGSVIRGGVGTEPAILAPNQSPCGITVDAQHVYWIHSGDPVDGATGKLSRVPRAGGEVTVLADALASPCYLAMDEANLYWTNGADGTVMTVAK